MQLLERAARRTPLPVLSDSGGRMSVVAWDMVRSDGAVTNLGSKAISGDISGGISVTNSILLRLSQLFINHSKVINHR